MAKVSKNVLDRLKEQREKLNARIQLVEARAKTSERKQDTRRKILIGSYYLDKARKDEAMHEINKTMAEYLKKDFDRELFGLEPLVKKD